MKNIQETRRKQLQDFIQQKFKSITDFSKKLGIDQANVSTLLNGTRPFTNFTANKIETAFSLPAGYLSSDEEHNFVLADFVGAKYYDDMKYLVNTTFEKNLKIPNEMIKLLKCQNEENIIVTYMNDDLMNPTIKKNEMIFVDYSQKKVEDGMIYLIEVNSFYRVRRLYNKKDSVSVHIDNPSEKVNYVVNTIPLSDIDIIGKLVGSFKTF